MKKNILIIVLLVVLVLFLGAYLNMQPADSELETIPDDNGQATAETEYLSFSYPADELVYSDGGFWTPEVAEQIGTTASDTMPFIRISSEPLDDRTLEQVAIQDHALGDVSSLEEASAFNPPFDESNSFGYKTLGAYTVLWVNLQEKFDLTTYYFEDGEYVHMFTTLFSDELNLTLIEDMILSTDLLQD